MTIRRRSHCFAVLAGLTLWLGASTGVWAAETVRVSFDSEPTGARVLADGQDLCPATPCEKELAPGSRQIEMQLDYHDIKRQLVLVKGPQKITWKLIPNAGFVSISADREGAEVVIDDRHALKLPVEKKWLEPGAHAINVVSRCTLPETQQFSLSVGQTKAFSLSLKPRLVKAKIDAHDKDGTKVAADVYLGDQNLGKTPLAVTVPVCTPNVELVEPKGGSTVVALTLSESKVNEIDAELKESKADEMQGPPEDTSIYQALPAKTSPVIGNETGALITIVQYSDFQCPFCGRVEETVRQVREHYGDKIRLYFRDFPLPFHPDARPAAKAALAARAQGKYWEMHARLFERNKELSREELIGHAKALGLDEARFVRDMDDPALEVEVERNLQSGLALGVRAVPCFFVNGRQLLGAQSYETFVALIDALLPLVEKTGLKGDALYEKVLTDRIGQGLSIRK